MKTKNLLTKVLLVLAIFCAATSYTFGQSGWTSVTTSDLNKKFKAVKFVNESTGYAIGGDFSRQQIYKSTDGGTAWLTQLDRQGYNLFAIAHSGENLWVVGGRGVILTSSNGGANWTTQYQYGDNLYDVHFINSNTGWAVGGVSSIGSIILRTTNGGANWNFLANQIYRSLKSVHFDDINNGMVVGDDGKVFRTTNGGTNWLTVETEYFEQFNSAAFPTSNTGWIAGNNGIIMKTVNGGTNWTLQSGNTKDNLNTVVFVNDNTGWISGDDGTMLKTTNGGTNWLMQNTGVTVDLYGVTFVNGNLGFAAGEDGIILKTTTGGSVGVTTLGANVPAGYKMSQNYPNPFNPSTKIKFDIPAASEVKMLVYNSAGQMISSLVDTRLAAGSYEVNFSGAKLSSGVYFCKIEAGQYNEVIKMTMVK